MCDPSVAPSPRSAIKEHGRTPSLINREGAMAGIKDWPKHVANGEIKRWSADSRLGICLQTRIVRGIDIDVPDPAIAQYIADTVARILGFPLPVRRRENTGKRLLAVIVRGDIPKRRMPVDGGMVEFLGTGQMFVAAGARKDGSRYYWEDGLPNHIPEISREQYDALVEQLAQELAVEPVKEASSTTRQRGEHLDIDDPVATWLEEQGLVLSETNTGGLIIECPWTDEHTSGEPGDSSTMWFPAGTNGHTTGHFKCLHSHCEHRNRSDFLAKVGYQDDVASDFEDLGPDPDAVSPNPQTGDNTDTPRFQVIPAGQFARRPAPRWIIKGVIPEADLGILYGASGDGKTFVMIDLAMAIARGVPWRGNKTRQGRVVYIAAEGGGGFRNRLLAYAQQHNVDLDDIPLGVIHATPSFLEKGDTKALIEAIKAGGPVALIVTDTYAQVTPGANENSAEDMGKALRNARTITNETGGMMMLIHHAGKDATKGARGWSGNHAAADAVLEVTRNGHQRALRTAKQKDGDDEAAWGFTLEKIQIGVDEDGEPIDSCVVLEAEVAPKADSKTHKAPVFGPWETAILDVFAELSVGGPVWRPKLLDLVADRFDKPEHVKVRKATALRALKNLCKAGPKKRLDMVEEMVVEAIE